MQSPDMTNPSPAGRAVRWCAQAVAAVRRAALSLLLLSIIAVSTYAQAPASLVRDIDPSGETFLDHLTPVNGTLFFAAMDQRIPGYKLWRSDGTDAGIAPVKDFHFGATDSDPNNLVNLNGTLLFTAGDGPRLEPLTRAGHAA